MPSKIISSFVNNDQAFAINFEIDSYDKDLVSTPVLNIWKDLNISLKQEEKVNAYIYLYHETRTSDTLESISRKYYTTTKLWWLILLINDVSDPFDFLRDAIDNELSIKILKPQYLTKVLHANKTNDISKYLGIGNVG